MLFKVPCPIVFSSELCLHSTLNKDILIISLPTIFSSHLKILSENHPVVYDQNFPQRYRKRIDQFIVFLHKKYQIDISLVFTNSLTCKIFDENLQFSMLLKIFQCVTNQMNIKIPLEEEIKIILIFIKKSGILTNKFLIASNKSGVYFFHGQKYQYLKFKTNLRFSIKEFSDIKIPRKAKTTLRDVNVSKLSIKLAFEAFKSSDIVSLINILNLEQKNVQLLGLETLIIHDHWVRLLLKKSKAAKYIVGSNAFLTID